MAGSWRSLCTGSGFRIDAAGVSVHLSEGRAHRVDISEADDSYNLSAVVLRAAAWQHAHTSPVRIWEMNRALNLVGFRIDERSRLIGESWLPKVDVIAEEFQAVVKNLAIECDRYEFMFTGRDVE